jgi:protein-S-isoprenylcysteine O-methyltransferase Ste14
MQKRVKSVFLVTTQMLLILVLVASTSFLHIPLLFYLFIYASLLLVIWASISMQKSKFRISPEPDVHAILITDGPYRYIRHPMYTAILLCVAGLLICQFTWLRLLMAVTLAFVLIFKLTWEERMLREKFPEYDEYMKRSKRILPFVVGIRNSESVH